MGSQLARVASQRFDVAAPSHDQVDVLDSAGLATFVRSSTADVVLNLVANTDVDSAERERGDESGLVYRLNVDAPRRLAELCRGTGKQLLHVSTDYVFDGKLDSRPYVESDPTGPLNWYAHTKVLGECEVLGGGDGACVARIEMPFTGLPARKLDFGRLCVQRLRAGQEITATTDQRITPLFLDDAGAALAFLAEAHAPGVIHVASSTWTTPYDYARAIATRLGLDVALVRPARYEQFVEQRPARRPQHSWLDVSRFQALPGAPRLHAFEDTIELFARQIAG